MLLETYNIWLNLDNGVKLRNIEFSEPEVEGILANVGVVVGHESPQDTARVLPHGVLFFE